jgi:predicted NACHT family NTPase
MMDFKFLVDFANRYNLTLIPTNYDLLWSAFLSPDLIPTVFEYLCQQVNQKDIIEPPLFKEPDPDLIFGKYQLAFTNGGNIWGLNEEEFPQNMMIIGRPGSGKTTFIINLILELSKE